MNPATTVNALAEMSVAKTSIRFRPYVSVFVAGPLEEASPQYATSKAPMSDKLCVASAIRANMPVIVPATNWVIVINRFRTNVQIIVLPVCSPDGVKCDVV